MSKIGILIYTLDIYNLQTKIVLFLNQDKLLKQVEGNWTCALYEFKY